MDPDPPASMRYTEARLARVANACSTISTRTRSISPTTTTVRAQEPSVLPARFPNLLVNGAGGIAVGMATNIPPHNLGEVIDGCLAFIDNPAITSEELIEIIPGPDFPTAPLILGTRRRARGLYHRARLDPAALPPRDRGRPRRPPLDRADQHPLSGRQVRPGREDRRGRQGQADRGRLRHPRRIQPQGRARGDRPQARRHRPTWCSTSCGGTPRRSRASPPTCWRSAAVGPRRWRCATSSRRSSQFREEVITRRTKFELNKARDRAHILLGLVIAVTNLDEVVRIIRGAPNPAAARAALLAREWPIGEIAPYIRAGRGDRARRRAGRRAPIACPKRR